VWLILEVLKVTFFLQCSKVIFFRKWVNFITATVKRTPSVKVKKVNSTVVGALRLCTGRTVHRGSRGIGKGKVHPCTGTEAL